MDEMTKPFPESYLILFNIAKEQNFGALIRSANAFGSNVLVVGKKKTSNVGATARTRLTPMRHFYTLGDAVGFCRTAGCEVLGLEIDHRAASVADQPFSGPTAFLIGNEGEGLTQSQRNHCDRLVTIRQFGTALCLNVNVATAIALHHFAEWSGRPATEISGAKFVSEDSVQQVHADFVQRLDSRKDRS